MLLGRLTSLLTNTHNIVYLTRSLNEEDNPAIEDVPARRAVPDIEVGAKIAKVS